MSSFFDRMAGLDEGEGETLTRSPLKTIAEGGGQTKADEKTTYDHGGPPGTFKHGDPNTRFRPQPKQDYGSDDTMDGDKKVKARALRTGKPAQHNTK